MEIAVFGATGATGVMFVRQALQEKHHLKLHCRSQSVSKLGQLISNELIEIIEGGFDDDFTLAIEGVEAVVIFLGLGLFWPAVNPLEKVMIKIMETMKKEGVIRFITMGTLSISHPFDKNSYKYNAMVFTLRLLQPNAYNDVVASIFSERADWIRFVLMEISEKQRIRKMPFISSV